VDHEEQPDALYDFLYRDSSRITSYYAQLFGGHLTSHEVTEGERDGSSKVLKPGLKYSEIGVSADFSTNKETQSSSKRVVNPHDLITTEVL
jgi:hypothetical protein